MVLGGGRVLTKWKGECGMMGSGEMHKGATMIRRKDRKWQMGAFPFAALSVVQSTAGTEWRVEEIGFNPYADVPVEAIGVKFIDGKVVDYTVEVTDAQGSYYVWARNLDYAAELQFYYGSARDFNLRNYEVNFATLDEVGSTDDSHLRVELLTPGQFHFATSLGGVDFRPEMLSATYDNVTGQLHYSVNQTGNISLGTAAEDYKSGITVMIDFIGHIMEEYLVVSRAFAVRMAMQGGLKDFAAVANDNALVAWVAAA
jgi:hypothetical protein